MKLRTIISIMTIFLLVVGGAGKVSPYTDLKPAAGITASSTIPLTPGPLLDDFTSGAGINSWGGATGAFAKSGTTAAVIASYPSDPAVVFGGSGRSLKLDYNVNDTESYAGYNTSLADYDLTTLGAEYLSFWIKGGAGTEFLKVELHHANYDPDRAVGYNNNYRAAVYVTDYLSGGVTTTWQKVTIPLDAFANIIDRTQMKEIVFTFENYQSNNNASPLIGTVYIDNICFGKQFLGFVKVDPFSYRDIFVSGSDYIMPLNSLGGQSNYTTSAYTRDDNSKAYVSSYTYNSSPYSMRLFFNFTTPVTGCYLAAYFISGGGDTGWVEVPRNLSRYANLSFWAKGLTTTAKGIRIELNDSGATTHYRYKKGSPTAFITTTWGQKIIPLSDFKTAHFATTGEPTGTDIVDLTTIKKVVFVTNDILYNWGSIPNSAVIYIDDVQFQSSTYAPDITAPATPGAPIITGSGTTRTISATASSGTTDASMENVRLEYYNGASWRAIGYDFDTTDGTYSTTWNLVGLPPGSYNVRAIAMDAAGNASAASGSTPVIF